MHKHIDGHYAFMDGKSDILIDHCHDLGAAYLRYVRERRAFVKIWPIKDVAILIPSQRSYTDDIINTLLNHVNS